MAAPLLAIAAISLVVGLLYKHLIGPYWLSPLARIPNAHWSSPVSDKWIEWRRNAGEEVLTIYALHQKHGPVVRLGPNEMSVNSINGLKTVYTGAFEKHPWYGEFFINFHTENLVGMSHNKPHATQKRMLSQIYSKSFLQESVDMYNIARTIFFQRVLPMLDRAATSQETVNVLPLFQAVGMDFTSAYLFGTQNSTTYCVNLPEWSQWLEEYEKFKYLSREARRGGFIESWCMSLCDRMQHDSASNKVPVKTEAIVYNRLRDSLQKSPDSRPLDLAIASELLDHLVAGHETTGITVTYILWELSKRPQLQDDLRKECLTLVPSLQHLSNSTEDYSLPSLPPASAIDSLSLLDAIVRETLRLHAPAPAPLPRVTPMSPDGITIGDYDNIPGGVRISSSAYSLHRIPEVYPTPLEWLPQRWLKPEPGKIHDMRRIFWPFGSGGRMCLGSNFALQGMNL